MQDNFQNIDFTGYDNVLFCGQGIINDFILLNKKLPNINIQFYSHIYDDNIINFLSNNIIKNLTLFATDSQKNKLSNYKNIITSPLPIRAIDPNTKYIKVNKILSSDVVIFLGGKYKNSQNKDVDVTDTDVKNMLLKIERNNSEIRSIAFVIHTRFTNSLNRMRIIFDIFKNKKIELYIPKTNFENVLQKYPNITFLDSYNDIVETLSHDLASKIKLYGTADQYNLFTDLCHIIPLAFHENDFDQKMYIKTLANSGCGSLTESIILFFTSK